MGLYSKKEEILNAITHYFGVMLGILGLILSIVAAVKLKSPIRIAAFSIYGASIIIMYLFSSIYHSIQHEKAKKVLRVFDHCSIFIMIAGSFTPVILLTFRGYLRILFIALIWTIALFGILFKSFTYGKFEKYKKLSLIIYLSMGWLAVFTLPELYLKEGIRLIIYLFIGGILYSIGAYFYANKKIPYNHAIWHIFIILASIVQYLGIYTTYL